MQLRYDEDFIEAAVFLCASGRRKGVPSLQIARFQRERECLYDILDPDDRNTAFFRLHLDWFREWGMEKLFTDAFNEFPLFAKALVVLAIRKTPRTSEEGAELYVNEAGDRNGLLALRIERLGNDSSLRGYLRHEFTHIRDMLDPAFGYSPTLDLPGANPAQLRLARERYRLLWDITIDGRLSAAGHAPMASRDQHTTAFGRGYPFWTEPRRAEVFASLWDNPEPRHAELLALIADPRGLREARRPAPGGSCPLCAFPTFTWANAEALPNEMIQRIQGEFSTWTAEQGLCARCQEMYIAAAMYGSSGCESALTFPGSGSGNGPDTI
jgi:hypothetical protein